MQVVAWWSWFHKVLHGPVLVIAALKSLRQHHMATATAKLVETRSFYQPQHAFLAISAAGERSVTSKAIVAAMTINNS
jgi:hypothetical protein